mmetsp:Transcript_3848/g.9654  ORF Transcript_3848/g.9654 Transcript_3848/m.9654 type:complete len:222 (-) Transcript_3848:285-950(-)
MGERQTEGDVLAVSPFLDVRPEFQLVSPCCSVLGVQVPVGGRYGVGVQEAVLSTVGLRLSDVVSHFALVCIGRPDLPINHDVRHVDAIGLHFASHTLGQSPQSELVHGQSSEPRPASQARRRTGQQNGAFLVFCHGWQHFLDRDKGAGAADLQVVDEHRRVKLHDGRWRPRRHSTAGIVHQHFYVAQLRANDTEGVLQALLTRRVGAHAEGLATLFLDGGL